MNLTAITHTLELLTGAAVATDWDVSWTDVDKSGASTVALPGSLAGTVSTATTTTIVAAPGATVYRAISSVAVRNIGASAQTVTVQRDVAGSNRVQITATLAAGEGLHYERGRGWYVMTAAGEVSQSGTAGTDGADGVAAVSAMTFAFGATPTDTASVVVADAGITAASRFLCGIAAGPTADNDAATHAFLALDGAISYVASAGSVTFTIQLRNAAVTGDVAACYIYS